MATQAPQRSRGPKLKRAKSVSTTIRSVDLYIYLLYAPTSAEVEAETYGQ